MADFMLFGACLRHRRLALLLCGGLSYPAAGVGQPSEAAAPLIPFKVASVSEDGRTFFVSWRGDHVHHVRIFAGTDAVRIGRERLIAEGNGSGRATIAQLPSAPRWYFELVPDRGQPLVIADRSLHLTTAANFRDAGGYRTQDGKWVRMGLLYRSNGIEHLTDEELLQIERLNIKLVCDLRTAEERSRGPDRVPEGAADVSVDVLADDADLIHSMIVGAGGSAAVPSVTPQAPAPASGNNIEERIYRDFVRLPSARRAYQALFERLADPGQLPTLFHCTAGKDRTGWAQAVLLTILGVPRSTIIEDYLLTNEYLQGAALNSVRQSLSAVATSKIVANPAALDAAFDQVMQDYGSLDGYLHQGLHLSDATLTALRRNFLGG